MRTGAADLSPEFARLPYVTELRSAESLSQRLGFAVEPIRIRVKPGHSAIVAWQRQGQNRLGGLRDWGWCAVVTSEDKLANVRRRAARAGESVTVHECSEPRSAGATGSVLISGPVLADAKLGKEIARANRNLSGAGGLGGTNELEVIGYNPGRRVLLKHTPQAGGVPELIRIGTHSQQHLVDTAVQWAEWGLPTLPVESIGGRGTAVRSPWWGTGDLETRLDPAVAGQVGVIIAQLHSRTPAEVGRRAGVSPLDQAVESAAVLSQLLPEASCAVQDIVRELRRRIGVESGTAAGAGGDRAIHGDLSPDQVLVGHPECRIIDLDRAGVGPAGMDLGRWAAACRRSPQLRGLETAFLDGYRQAGGTETDLEAWTAWAMLVAGLEPWRSCDPMWKDTTMTMIDEARTTLGDSATVGGTGQVQR